MSVWADAIAYGTHADRPAAGLPGRLYCESDTGAILRDNGVTWDQVATAAAAGALDVLITGVDATLPAASMFVLCTANVTITFPAAADNSGKTVIIRRQDVSAGQGFNALFGTDEWIDTWYTLTDFSQQIGTFVSDGAHWWAVDA